MTSLDISVSKGWIAERLNVCFDRDYYFDPQRRYEIDSRCADYVERELGGIKACFTESNLGRREYIRDGHVLVGGIQPNIILGMLLGAEFVPGMDKDADIMPECFAGHPLADLPSPATLVEHPLIRKFSAQVEAVRQEGEREPIPPFFWDMSGRAAVHGSLTTAQKFVGTSVFMDLAVDPDAIAPLLDWVTEANARLVKHFAQIAAIKKISDIHIGECAACMVGRRQFEKLVVPQASRLGKMLGPIRFHSCGKSNHLVESFSRIENLSSLDLGGETSLALVRDVFGPDFPVSIAPPVKTLCDGAASVLDWISRIFKENSGGPLSIVCHIEPHYNLEAIHAMVRFVTDRPQPSWAKRRYSPGAVEKTSL